MFQRQMFYKTGILLCLKMVHLYRNVL